MSRHLSRALSRPSRVAAAGLAAVAMSAGTVVAAGQPASAASTSSVSVYGAKGLKAWPAAVGKRVAAKFDIAEIGGYRPGDGSSDHNRGMAVDFMVRGERGDRLAEYLQDHARSLNIKYIIWEQGYWQPGMSGYRKMEDRGGDTANHFDHVHVSFEPGSGSF